MVEKLKKPEKQKRMEKKSRQKKQQIWRSDSISDDDSSGYVYRPAMAAYGGSRNTNDVYDVYGKPHTKYYENDETATTSKSNTRDEYSTIQESRDSSMRGTGCAFINDFDQIPRRSMKKVEERKQKDPGGGIFASMSWFGCSPINERPVEKPSRSRLEEREAAPQTLKVEESDSLSSDDQSYDPDQFELKDLKKELYHLTLHNQKLVKLVERQETGSKISTSTEIERVQLEKDFEKKLKEMSSFYKEKYDNNLEMVKNKTNEEAMKCITVAEEGYEKSSKEMIARCTERMEKEIAIARKNAEKDAEDKISHARMEYKNIRGEKIHQSMKLPSGNSSGKEKMAAQFANQLKGLEKEIDDGRTKMEEDIIMLKQTHDISISKVKKDTEEKFEKKLADSEAEWCAEKKLLQEEFQEKINCINALKDSTIAAANAHKDKIHEQLNRLEKTVKSSDSFSGRNYKNEWLQVKKDAESNVTELKKKHEITLGNMKKDLEKERVFKKNLLEKIKSHEAFHAKGIAAVSAKRDQMQEEMEQLKKKMSDKDSSYRRKITEAVLQAKNEAKEKYHKLIDETIAQYMLRMETEIKKEKKLAKDTIEKRDQEAAGKIAAMEIIVKDTEKKMKVLLKKIREKEAAEKVAAIQARVKNTEKQMVLLKKKLNKVPPKRR